MADSRTVRRLVERLLDDARDEYSQYLELLISAYLQENDADPADIELVVDTFDPERIAMYPRIKPVVIDGPAVQQFEPW